MGQCMYRASGNGVDENLLVLLHGLGDTAGAAWLGLRGLQVACAVDGQAGGVACALLLCLP